MELNIAQLLQNSRKDDLPLFSGRGNMSRCNCKNPGLSLSGLTKCKNGNSSAVTLLVAASKFQFLPFANLSQILHHVFSSRISCDILSNLAIFLWKRQTNHLPFDLCRLKIEILRHFSKFRIRFLKICGISNRK